jgi:tetratricopeptide (TPR) repeat protein
MIRRVSPIAAFFVLALLVILGTRELLTQAQRNVVLIRLPEAPALNGRSEALREKINGANAEVRIRLVEGGVNTDFGQATGELGRLYQANHFYDHALSCYRLAREYNKQSPAWFYLPASIHQQRGETESMIGFLKRTLSLSPGYSPAVLKLADTYFKVGEMQSAKTYYERRLALVPGDPYALMGLARIAMDQAQWDIAGEHLRKALSSDPRFGDAHRLMAEVHEHHDRTEEMKKSLDRAAKCTRFRPAPDPWVDDLENLCYDPEQLLVLGAMALTELDIETAVKKHFARALEIDPKNPEAHLAMGKAWFMAGEWSRAHQYLMRTIELDPTSDQAYFHLGLILRNQNKLRDAEAMLLKALEYQPNNANVLNNLGVILLEQGRYSEAIESLHEALEVYPEHINARYNLGMSLWASGNSKEAVSQYSQVLEMKPNWGVAANSLAWILATDRDQVVRNGDEAVRWAQVAVQGENERNPEYLDTLAAAYAEAAQYEKAVQVARQALSIAREGGAIDQIDSIEGRLRRYQSGRPFHD